MSIDREEAPGCWTRVLACFTRTSATSYAPPPLHSCVGGDEICRKGERQIEPRQAQTERRPSLEPLDERRDHRQQAISLVDRRDDQLWDAQLQTLGCALARGSSSCARARYCAGVPDVAAGIRARLQEARALERSGIEEAIRELERSGVEAMPGDTTRWELRSLTPAADGHVEYADALLADLARHPAVRGQADTTLRGRLAAKKRSGNRIAAFGRDCESPAWCGAEARRDAGWTVAGLQQDEQEDVERAVARSIREYKDVHGWACEDPACLTREPFASDYELGCHERTDHGLRGPLPISSDAFMVVMAWLPRIGTWIWLLSRVDRRCAWLIHHLLRPHLEACPAYGRFVRGATIFGTMEAGWHPNDLLKWYEESLHGKLQRRWFWDTEGRLISDPEESESFVPIRCSVGVSYELVR
jgi:hypothetical protein